jgi:hypothetical protein
LPAEIFLLLDREIQVRHSSDPRQVALVPLELLLPERLSSDHAEFDTGVSAKLSQSLEQIDSIVKKAVL